MNVRRIYEIDDTDMLTPQALHLEDLPSQSKIWDVRSRTTACINASAIIERVDEQLLPALYSAVGRSFQARPSQLGTLTLARALAQAIASPLAGILGHYTNRVTVVCIGSVIWGTCTLGFSMTNSVAAGLPLWAMNGVGLSFLIPQAQSLTADYNPEHHRGRAFGLLHLTGAVGALLGALFATNVGHTQPFGLDGWRFAFIIVALASWNIGLSTWLLAVDPRYLPPTSQYKVAAASEVAGHATWRTTARDLWQVITTPTFGIIVLQGIVGSTPWSALVFLTLYFQLLGMSDLVSSLLMAVFLAFNALGGLLGGYIGDWAASKWPLHGRIFACQFSVGLGVPLSFVLFKGLPLSPATPVVLGYAAVLAVTGLTITWAATACNNPIFSEIVPSHARNLIYAFDRSFEGAIAATGAPLVGILAEKAFGFSGAAEKSADQQENLLKAASLGNALLIFTSVPWLLCVIFFTGLHWTYPRDKQRALERSKWPWEEEEIVVIIGSGGGGDGGGDGGGGGEPDGIELTETPQRVSQKLNGRGENKNNTGNDTEDDEQRKVAGRFAKELGGNVDEEEDGAEREKLIGPAASSE